RQRRPLQVRRPSLLRLPEEESEGIQRCRRGESIDEGIRRAIDNSNFYVVVLTENYASSPWCLDELVMIMDNCGRGEEMVFPVFYHVLPDDVSGGGCYKLDGVHRRNYGQERVERWVEALDWIARIAGWVVAIDQ
ncbi:Disease resistance protein RPV1, partial [Linum grandiflorum]